MATADGTGTKNGDYIYSPFGQTLNPTTNSLVTPSTPTVSQPNNVASNGSFSWVGKNEKITETAFALTPVQMGARVYIPGIGRFTSVDPDEGGTANNYVYANDPVNQFDLSGQCIGPLLAYCIIYGVPLATAALTAAIDYYSGSGGSSGSLGRAGESAVGKSLGLSKNTQKITINGRDRIPDFLTSSSLHEVKNTKTLSYTSQLRDYNAIAKNSGRSFVLHTRTNTRLSKPLQRQIDSGKIIHRKHRW